MTRNGILYILYPFGAICCLNWDSFVTNCTYLRKSKIRSLFCCKFVAKISEVQKKRESNIGTDIEQYFTDPRILLRHVLLDWHSGCTKFGVLGAFRTVETAESTRVGMNAGKKWSKCTISTAKWLEMIQINIWESVGAMWSHLFVIWRQIRSFAEFWTENSQIEAIRDDCWKEAAETQKKSFKVIENGMELHSIGYWILWCHVITFVCGKCGVFSKFERENAQSTLRHDCWKETVQVHKKHFKAIRNEICQHSRQSRTSLWQFLIRFGQKMAFPGVLTGKTTKSTLVDTKVHQKTFKTLGNDI